MDEWILNWLEIYEYSSLRSFYLISIDLLSIMNEISLSKKEFTCSICRLVRLHIIAKLNKLSNPKMLKGIRSMTDGLSLNENLPCNDQVDLHSLSKNNHFSGFPVFTPLIGFDGKEIQNLKEKISKNLRDLDYCEIKPKNQAYDMHEAIKIYNELKFSPHIDKALNKMKIIKFPLNSIPLNKN